MRCSLKLWNAKEEFVPVGMVGRSIAKYALVNRKAVFAKHCEVRTLEVTLNMVAKSLLYNMNCQSHCKVYDIVRANSVEKEQKKFAEKKKNQIPHHN